MALRKKKAVKAAAESKTKPTAAPTDYKILLSPRITEKSAVVSSDQRRAVFEVDRRASKDEIKKAVEKIFNVKVEHVRTCNYMGKIKRTTRSVGRRAAFKKAYVTVKEGQTINIVEGV
jgi:large subunit ribosomal protein L23